MNSRLSQETENSLAWSDVPCFAQDLVLLLAPVKSGCTHLGQSQGTALGTRICQCCYPESCLGLGCRKQMIHHLLLVCPALLTAVKCFCFAREARVFHAQANPTTPEDVGTGGNALQPSPAAVPVHLRGYVAPFCSLTNIITENSAVQMW